MASSQFAPYNAFYGPVKCGLESLSAILKKGQESPNAASLPSARLIDDMQPLTFQVFAVCNSVDRLVSRTMGAERTRFEDNMKTFEDMQARIADAQALLASASEDVVNGKANDTVALPTEEGAMEDFPIHLFVSTFCLPNLSFHVSIAYAILRKEGVKLGKDDYLSPFQRELLANKAS